MPEALRKLRVEKAIPAKDMVAVVRELYPKYDKTMQSKCERGSEYGINIRPDAMRALYEKFDPDKLNRKRDSGHRLTCRISCRLEDDVYASLMKVIEASEFETTQDWLAHMVRQCIEKAGGSHEEKSV